ncbi:MAG: energy transducer TonB [Pyrinomonadaceae bacterium]
MKPVVQEPEVSEEMEKMFSDDPVPDATQDQPDDLASDELVSAASGEEEPPALEIAEPEIEETVFEPVSFDAEEDLMTDDFDESLDEEIIEISVEPEQDEKVTVAGGAVTTLFGDEGIPERADDPSADERSVIHEHREVPEDYNVTVIGNGEGKLRSRLMLGASLLVLSVAFGSFMYSIFNHPYFVASIDDDYLLAPLTEVEPMPLEEEPKKDNDEDGGGGGGGGRENKKPASAGELPSQTRDPIPQPPQVLPRLTNPSLPQIQRTEGDIKRERTDRVGIPGSLNGDASSGMGSGGGIGEGRGTGAGNGRGTGEGNGIGSGSGNGNGDGNGDGNGNGGRRPASNPPPERPSGPTTGIQIRSKPRPGYTDTARQNNVQGTVMLRVTFQANGTIGSISPIKGLPNGLTEKAIAAARQISFTPAMRNGQPYSVTKSIQYNFTIY